MNGQMLFICLGKPQICVEKSIVCFMCTGRRDVVISFIIVRHFEHISLESEPFSYLDYCMLECA